MALAVGLWAVCMACGAVEPSHRLSTDTERMLLSDSVGIFIDKSGRLGADDVAALAGTDAMARAPSANMPFTLTDPGRVVWFMLDFQAEQGVSPDWLLEVGRAHLGKVTLYVPDGRGSWAGSAAQGAAIPRSAWGQDWLLPTFPVRVQPGTSSKLLLRIDFAGPSAVTAVLWRPAALLAERSRSLAFYCLYLGLVVGALFYNLLLYAVVRDRGSPLYAGCVAFTALGFAAHTGVGGQFLWGEFPEWNSRALLISWALAGAFSTALARQFLRTGDRFPRIDKLLLGVIWVLTAGVAGVAFLPLNLPTLILVPAGMVVPMGLTALAAVAAWRRVPGGPYFFSAWLALHFGVIVQQLRVLGAVPDNIWTANGVAIGSAVEMILLALALADRINGERKLREEAQAVTVGILHALHAFASETRMDKLYDQVCDAMARMAGASDVRLLLRDGSDQQWLLYAPAQPWHRTPAAQAQRQGLLAPGVVDEVQKTGRPARIGQDVLALPVVHHGKLVAILQLSFVGAARGCGGGLDPMPSTAIESIASGLALSIENVTLYQELEQRVTDRTRELRNAQRELVSTARRAGMAEIATNVLHNVGNMLNSVNVAADTMRVQLRESAAAGVQRAASLVDEHRADLHGFLASERGAILPRYLREVATAVSAEREKLLANLEDLRSSIDHINNVIAVQQSYAGSSVLTEPVEPAHLFEDALRLVDSSFADQPVEVVKGFEKVEAVTLDKSRLMQILVNLVTNARQAMEAVPSGSRSMQVALCVAGGKLRFQVRDNGCGIDPHDMGRLFSHGFARRKGGHGFGLHSCIVACREMGGTLTAASEGLGRGSTFTLELPLDR